MYAAVRTRVKFSNFDGYASWYGIQDCAQNEDLVIDAMYVFGYNLNFKRCMFSNNPQRLSTHSDEHFDT